MRVGSAIEDIPLVSCKTKDWSSLSQPPISQSRDLELLTPSTDSSFHMEFDDQDATAAKDNWRNSLVGYFIGMTPSFSSIKASLQRAWRINDLDIVYMLDGFFLFKFMSHDAGQAILDDGPRFVHGHALIHKRWSEDNCMSRDDLATRDSRT